jgi:capsular polysaccharide biosynthesis protein
LFEIVSALRSRWWQVLLAVAVAIGAGAVATARQRPLYRASASLVVAPTTAIDDPADILRSLETLERRSIIATFARIPGSREAQRAVAGQVGLSDLDGWRIEGSVVPNTNILRIDAEGPDAARVAQVANAAAEATRQEARALYRIFTMRTLAEATPPTQAALPDWPRNLLVATAIGLLLGVLAACGAERLRPHLPRA